MKDLPKKLAKFFGFFPERPTRLLIIPEDEHTRPTFDPVLMPRRGGKPRDLIRAKQRRMASRRRRRDTFHAPTGKRRINRIRIEMREYLPDKRRWKR